MMPAAWGGLLSEPNLMSIQSTYWKTVMPVPLSDAIVGYWRGGNSGKETLLCGG